MHKREPRLIKIRRCWPPCIRREETFDFSSLLSSLLFSLIHDQANSHKGLRLRREVAPPPSPAELRQIRPWSAQPVPGYSEDSWPPATPISYAPCLSSYSAFALPMSYNHHACPKVMPEHSHWPPRKRLRSARFGLKSASGKLPELRLRRCRTIWSKTEYGTDHR